MVRAMVLMIGLGTLALRTEAATNVSVCVGAQWPSNFLAAVSARDSSTPETVFLGVVRALNTANLRDLYFHFETNYLYRLVGVYQVNELTEEMVSSFRSVMSDPVPTNIVIVAYSQTETNNARRVSATIRECYPRRTMQESFVLTLQQQPAGWKVISYDDDKWDD